MVRRGKLVDGGETGWGSFVNEPREPSPSLACKIFSAN